MLSGMAFGVGTLAKYNAPFFALALFVIQRFSLNQKRSRFFQRIILKQ